MILNSVSPNFHFNFPIKKITNSPLQKAEKDSLKTLNLNNCAQNIYFKGTINNDNLPIEIASKIPQEFSIKTLLQMAQNEENILGIGANSKVYNIPYLDDYVLKVLNKDDPNKVKIGEFPPDINLGQPVWQDDTNPRILILKKIEGIEYSIPQWSKVIWDQDIYSPHQVTKQDAQNYFEKLSKIAKMPQQAFDSLAQDAKIIDDYGFKMDSINPNNLIVDFEKEKIHVIDFFKVKDGEKDIYRNCNMDLMALISDFTLFPEYYDKLDAKNKEQSLKYLKTAFEKVNKASQNAGLSCDDNRFKKYIRTTSRWFCANSVAKEDSDEVYFRYYDVRLEDFLNMLNNPKKWADDRKNQP